MLTLTLWCQHNSKVRNIQQTGRSAHGTARCCNTLLWLERVPNWRLVTMLAVAELTNWINMTMRYMNSYSDHVWPTGFPWEGMCLSVMSILPMLKCQQKTSCHFSLLALIRVTKIPPSKLVTPYENIFTSHTDSACSSKDAKFTSKNGLKSC